MKNIAGFHYITQDHPEYSHADLTRMACSAGIRWVQVRVKNRSESEWRRAAREALDVCREFEAICIINDSPEVAASIGAHGVHLGLSDRPADEAREILGTAAIIGGTANTIEEIALQVSRGVDYVGIGPFRHTETKKNLSSLLGLEGYRRLVSLSIRVPLIAVGGILKEDIKDIFSTGLHGVAVSSAIHTVKDPAFKAREFLDAVREAAGGSKQAEYSWNH